VRLPAEPFRIRAMFVPERAVTHGQPERPPIWARAGWPAAWNILL